ncbi:unnamed protein product [Cuscuta epithymum]|uniref:Tetraspanin/Peripherin n=1 Tax=Cuscuta epithymum TaxID=186058 RepID=A0AAV0DSI2_9ASTE|nr:unnamed protein product [Cuscuta epithymum]
MASLAFSSNSCKNPCIALMNYLSFLSAIPILVGGVWVRSRAKSTDCFEFLHWPIILIAVAIMVVSVAGFAGAFYGIDILIYVYVWCTFGIMVVLVGFLFFAYGVTEGTGRPVLNRMYMEYFLLDFPDRWLKETVTSPGSWREISYCVRGSGVCGSMMRRGGNAIPQTAAVFYRRELSPIESGCCKPPTACAYGYVNDTFWRPQRGTWAADQDCGRWNNAPEQLCYNCDSCKAGVLGSLKNSWRKASVINTIMLFYLMAVYVVACTAFRLKKDEEPYYDDDDEVKPEKEGTSHYNGDETYKSGKEGTSHYKGDDENEFENDGLPYVGDTKNGKVHYSKKFKIEDEEMVEK